MVETNLLCMRNLTLGSFPHISGISRGPVPKLKFTHFISIHRTTELEIRDNFSRNHFFNFQKSINEEYGGNYFAVYVELDPGRHWAVLSTISISAEDPYPNQIL